MSRELQRLVRRCVLSGILVAIPLLKAQAAEDPAPSLQDMQITARVLSFQDSSPTGTLVLSMVYNAADPRSRDEANAITAIVGGGLNVGGLTLRMLPVEQANLAAATGYGAIFITTGVNDQLLKATLERQKVPCLTRHLEQVENGVCTVAIRSVPSVSITLSQANAAAAGVHFATAFRMMVREL